MIAARPQHGNRNSPNKSRSNVFVTSIFTIGDRVVHPQHGVGENVLLADREFERGKPGSYYKISIPNGSTIWVQVDNPFSGLCYLAPKKEIDHCRKVLAAKAVSL